MPDPRSMRVPKAGRPPSFSAADVVAAALAEGIDRFTLAAVAERLGVATPAIYRTFESREALLVACLDAAGETFARPEPGMAWRDTLARWADECWRVCEDFPGLVRVLYTYPAAPARNLQVIDAYVENLVAQGRTPGQATFALDLVGDTVLASYMGVESMRAVGADGRSGLDRLRDAAGETHPGFVPDESWLGRGPADMKVGFILNALATDWPSL